MNEAHVHLVTNHLPIIIPFIALVVLIIGMISIYYLKNEIFYKVFISVVF
jgi:hypothetical protein